VLLLPGPHFAFPRPIDEVTNIPFTSLQWADSTIGWYQAPGGPPPYPMPSIDPASGVSYMLTADTNILHLRARVTYRITKPITFYFEFANALDFVTNDLNNALLFAASRFTVDDIRSGQPTAFREAVVARMHELVERQGLGITVDQVNADSAVPQSLLNDFASVDNANAERDTTLSKAHSYEQKTLGDARANHEARIKGADSERARMVGLLGASQTNFSRLLGDYERNPQLVISLLEADVLKRAWTNAESLDVLPDLGNSSMRFHLGEPIPNLTVSTNSPSP
jgi:membrane protease subunit HflK